MAQEIDGLWVNTISNTGLEDLKKIMNGVDKIGVAVENGKFVGLVVAYFDCIILESGIVKSNELKTFKLK